MKSLNLVLAFTSLIGMAASASMFPKHLPNFAGTSNTANSRASKVLYYGGPVISNPQVTVILWGSNVAATTKAAMPDFYASMVNSNYMDFLKEYNTTSASVQGGVHTSSNQTLGRGTFLQTIEIAPAKVSGSIDDLEIQAELQKQITAGKIPAPSADSLYMVHFPKGLKITFHDGSTVATSCQQFCAYHGAFKPATGSPVIYGVIPDLDSLACSMGCGSGGSLARITVSASHELIEATTDVFPTPGTTPDYPQAWNTSGGEEIGDLCQSNTGKLTGHAATCTIQQEYSNALGGCTTGNYTSSL